MLYACVRKFDVTGSAQAFLGTKRSILDQQGSSDSPRSLVASMESQPLTSTSTCRKYFLFFVGQAVVQFFYSPIEIRPLPFYNKINLNIVCRKFTRIVVK